VGVSAPSDLAGEAGIQIQSAWAYLNKAVTMADPDELRRVWKGFVNRAVVRELRRMKRDGDERLGASLTDLKAAVEERLQPQSSYFALDDEDRWRHLRFARLAITRVGMDDDD
jgi:hypothetical protein